MLAVEDGVLERFRVAQALSALGVAVVREGGRLGGSWRRNARA